MLEVDYDLPRSKVRFVRWLENQIGQANDVLVLFDSYKRLGGSPLARLEKLIFLRQAGIPEILISEPLRGQMTIDLNGFYQAEGLLRRESLRASLDLAKRSGVVLGRPRKVTEALASRVFELHQSGLGVNRTAKAVGLSRSSVQRILKKNTKK